MTGTTPDATALFHLASPAADDAALKILLGKYKPNLGLFMAPPDWQEILEYFRGSELQNYFTKLLQEELKVRALCVFWVFFSCLCLCVCGGGEKTCGE